MFPLHETTQRWACRVAFALLCVVPTTSLLAYAMWLKTPVHRGRQSEALSQRTGTAVSVKRLLYPRPGETRMHDIVLAHSQSGEAIAHIRELEITRDGERVTLYAAQPQLIAGQAGELWRQCERLLLDESFPSASSARLIAKDATITSEDGEAQTLTVLDAEFHARREQRVLTLKYQLAGQGNCEPATLRIVHADGTLAEIHWHTGGDALPVAPWAEQLPWLKRMGVDCRFRGELHANKSATGWSGHVAGAFSRVDLNRLISDAFPGKLSGQAEIIIDEARFSSDRVNEVRGSIAAGPGVIGNALLADADEEWNLTNDDEGASQSTMAKLIRYEQISFDFVIDNGQISLTGTCDDAPSGTVVSTGDGHHWRATAQGSYNVASLVRILAGKNDTHVPATDATRAMIRWLPLSKKPREQETEKPPQSHLRGL